MRRANQYFAAGDYRRAQLEYLNVLQFGQRDVLAVKRLGIISLEDGATVRAYAYLAKARLLAPEDTEILAKQATVLLQLGEKEEAQKQAAEVLAQSPANDEALLVLGDAIESAADVALAEKALWEVPGRKSAAYHLVWAKIAAFQQDPVWRENEIRQALEAEPGSFLAHLALAEFLLARGQVAEAGEKFAIAVRNAPVRSDARIRYARFQASRDGPEAAKTYLRSLTNEAPDFISAWQLLAEIAFDQKHLDEARATLEKIFAADFDSLKARLLESEIFLTQGETQKAVESLQRLSTAYPDVPLFSYRLARAFIQNNDSESAEIALQKALARSPNYADAILLLAQLKMQRGQPALAASALLRLLEKQPQLTAARLMLEDAYQSAGRIDDAIDVAREQVKLFPDSVEAYFRLGTLLREGQHLSQARAALAKAMELAPVALAPWAALVELDIAARDFAAALGRVQERLAKEPKMAAAQLLLGKIYFAQKDWPRAEEALSAALDLDPHLPGASELLISTYIAADDVPQATQRLLGILASNPADERTLTTLALLYHSTKQFEKARDAYEKILALNPNSTASLNNLAFLYAEEFKQLDKGYELARRARTLQPGDPAVADTFGWILFRQARYPEAFALLSEAAAKLPDNPDVQYHFGTVSYMMDKLDVARGAFRKASEAAIDSPGKEEAGRWLAFLQSDSGGTREFSLEQLETLVQQRPDDVIARARLGEAYEREGQIEQAAAAYEKALSSNPNLVNATVRLAQIYSGPIPKPAQALALAKHARELAPSDPNVTAVLGRVASHLGQFAWAYNLLQMSARNRPNDWSVLHDYAWAAYGVGKTEEARALMQQVVDGSPVPKLVSDAQLFLRATLIEGKPEEMLAAEGEITLLRQTHPEYLPGLMLQAAVQNKKGAPKAAAATYTEILRRFPDFAPAERFLAPLVAENVGGLDRAYDLANKARQIMPTDPDLARLLGELCFRKKQFLYSVQLLQESAKAKTLDAKGLYFLGMSLLSTQQPREGQNALESALAAGLTDPLATQAKTELGNLKNN